VHYPGDVVSTLPGVEHAVEPGSDDDVMKLSKVGIANNLGDQELDEKSRQEIEREEGLEDVRRSDPRLATLLQFAAHILLCPEQPTQVCLVVAVADQACQSRRSTPTQHLRRMASPFGLCWSGCCSRCASGVLTDGNARACI